MKSIYEFENLFIHRKPVDMRKNINGLSAIVSEEMKLELKAKSLFIFCNQKRTRLKILYFDKSGFALWLKKLEESKFPWPGVRFDKEVLAVQHHELEMILEGINIWTRFEKVHFDYVT